MKGAVKNNNLNISQYQTNANNNKFKPNNPDEGFVPLAKMSKPMDQKPLPAAVARPQSRNSNASPKAPFWNLATSPCDSGFDSVGSSPSSDSGLLKTQANTPTSSSPFVEPAPPAPKDIPFNQTRNGMSVHHKQHHLVPTDPRLRSRESPIRNKTTSPRPSGTIFNSKNNQKTTTATPTTSKSPMSSSSSPQTSPFRSPQTPLPVISSSQTAATNTVIVHTHPASSSILKIPAFARSPQVRTHIRRVKQLTKMKRQFPIDPMFAADYFDSHDPVFSIGAKKRAKVENLVQPVQTSTPTSPPAQSGGNNKTVVAKQSGINNSE